MTDAPPAAAQPTKKTRPTAIEINEPEVEYTPLSNDEAESREKWLEQRAAIRARNKKNRASPRVAMEMGQMRKQPEVPIGRLGAPEAGPSGLARKRTARQENPVPEKPSLNRQEWYDRWEREKDLVYGSLAGDPANGGSGGNGGNDNPPPPPSPSMEPTPGEMQRRREMAELAEMTSGKNQILTEASEASEATEAPQNFDVS